MSDSSASQASYTVRLPRHAALPNSGCRVTIEWIASVRTLEAELGDLSRKGTKLILDSKLPQDARMKVHFEQPTNQFSVTLPVTIRWSRQLPDGRWSAGCLFDHEISWELMGEFFLNGILDTEELTVE